MPNAQQRFSRRDALPIINTSSIAATVRPLTASAAFAAPTTVSNASLIPGDAWHLKGLTERLAKAPRRRDFKSIPMILTDPNQWDHEALTEVLHYEPKFKQVSDNNDIATSWLDPVRNTINAEIWSFRHPDFLAVVATRGTAQLALYDQFTWDKYQLTRLAGGKFKTNTLIGDTKAASADPAKFEDPAGVFSQANNTIPALMRRGVVFLACHCAAWEHAEALLGFDINPDDLKHEELTADLTNHLIPGVIMTPVVTGALSELVRAGFQYVK
jgi:hypothetical protein